MQYGKLYLVATPIGNLEDITYRALKVLGSVELIACEDTRHSMKLLNHFDIQKPLTSYFEHNKKEKGDYIISVLKTGKDVALVTDAGTPAISDPGEDLVRMCIAEDISVVPVPGAAALINALIISGQDTGRFCFEGFLSVNKKSRNEHLNSLLNEKRTMIFHEAPHKLVRTLADMHAVFGNRPISIVRELTKLHEECMVTTLEQAVAYYEDNNPKGEYVLVLAGKSDAEQEAERDRMFADISVKEHVDTLIAQGLSKKDAIKEAAKQRGAARRDVYNEYEKY
ncbi:MAG: 16S rRNA (cytidine(1402)-2'-O)-methyltransferase [Clostridia bacterium]|nr:16S rRNA (cytidine(1402)-2'-O)-methyltransferase [Clostridia bacterium]